MNMTLNYRSTKKVYDMICDSTLQLQMSRAIYTRIYIGIKLRVEITHYEIKMSMLRFIC